MKKTILITGATNGIGLLAAKKLNLLDNKILIHGRNKEKLISISKELNNAAVYVADLSNMEAVVKMSETLLLEHKTIDIVINNAGILKTNNTKTVHNRDIRFDVNTLAPPLLSRTIFYQLFQTQVEY